MKKSSSVIVLAVLLAGVVSQADAQAAYFTKKDKKKVESDTVATQAKASADTSARSAYDTAPAYSTPAPAPAAKPTPPPAAATKSTRVYKSGEFDFGRYKGRLTGNEIVDKISNWNRQISDERDEMVRAWRKQGISAAEIQRKADEFDAKERNKRLDKYYDELYKA